MAPLATILGLALIAGGLWDAFETVILPRRVVRQLRISSIFYRLTWRPYAFFASRVHDDGRREAYLSFYGPLSLLLLVGVWATVLVLGFGVLHWAAGSSVTMLSGQPPDLGIDLYLSGTTFFTLGLGDVVPTSGVARALTVIEAGTGFAFLALVIGYLPIVYQMFARREMNVSQLDQRAGSPPSAVELLRRNVEGGDLTELIRLLHDWELWVADLLESHLSYPTLAYFRSQHENESWVAGLAVILDVSAFVLACGVSQASRQAGFTLAVSRHAVADLTNVFGEHPRPPTSQRLTPETAERLWEAATARGLLNNSADIAQERLTGLRGVYEPYLEALADYLLMPLPPWAPPPGAQDNWETTAWDYASPAALLGPGAPFIR
jgi:hypothetical protein